MKQVTPTQPLSVTIRDREKVLFTGIVTALSSVNEKGVFDVLPQHINFISIISDYVILHNPDNTTKKFDLTTGIMQVSSNLVNVFLGILTPQVTPQRKISALEYLKSHPTKSSK